MTRIGDLQKKYPKVPLDIIVKWDVATTGVQDSPELDKLSFWRPASQASFQSYDADFTIQRMKAETPWRIKGNQVLTPMGLMMKSGIGFGLYRRVGSPYSIKVISEGKFGLFEGETMIDIDLIPHHGKQKLGPELVTSKGVGVGEYVETKRRCFKIVPVRFCEYFTTGEECKFCNFNPSQEDARAAGLHRATTINLDEAAEAFKIQGTELHLVEGFVENGGFAKVEAEASVNVRFVERLKNALPYRFNLTFVGEAMPRRELQRLKDGGLDSIRMQMEVFNERLFPLMVPGKAKHLGRDGWLEAYDAAVEIFGAGQVGAKFVGGATMQGPDGFSTWQEARDAHIEGDRYMISRGVFPGMQALRWAPGSPFSRDEANRNKYPPTEYYLDQISAHHAACNEYGLYDKLNKFLYCTLCCGYGDGYQGEMGIIERCGDVGNWFADTIPYEYNWVAQALASWKSPAKTN